MDYEKNYPITQRPGSYLLMQWERGYKRVELSHNDRLINSFTGAQVKKGLRINDAELGVLQLKFSENPMGIDLIIDGYHSPVNRSHPKNELMKTAVFFYMLGSFALIGAFLYGIYLPGFKVGVNLVDYPTLVHEIETYINLAVVTCYFVMAYHIGKSRPWAYLVGFVVYCLFFLLALLTAFIHSNGLTIIVLLFRIAFVVVLSMNLKHFIGTIKHAKYRQPQNDELLDL